MWIDKLVIELYIIWCVYDKMIKIEILRSWKVIVVKIIVNFLIILVRNSFRVYKLDNLSI